MGLPHHKEKSIIVFGLCGMSYVILLLGIFEKTNWIQFSKVQARGQIPILGFDLNDLTVDLLGFIVFK